MNSWKKQSRVTTLVFIMSAVMLLTLAPLPDAQAHGERFIKSGLIVGTCPSWNKGKKVGAGRHGACLVVARCVNINNRYWKKVIDVGFKTPRGWYSVRYDKNTFDTNYCHSWKK